MKFKRLFEDEMPEIYRVKKTHDVLRGAGFQHEEPSMEGSEKLTHLYDKTTDSLRSPLPGEELSRLGWTLQNPPKNSYDRGPFTYHMGDRMLMHVVVPAGGEWLHKVGVFDGDK